MNNFFNHHIKLLSTVIVIIFATAFYVWNLSQPNNHILSIKDCGEVFIAQHQVQNFRLYGFKYWLLEDHATAMDKDRTAFLYTHNVHIGSLSFQILDYLGIKTFAAKQLFTLFIFSLGLLYVYLAINYITNSKLISLTTLMFSLTDMNQVLAFATNALRAWHWLAIFGILYHTSKYSLETHDTYKNKLALLVFMTIAFGIGYEFFAICTLMALITILVFGNQDETFIKSKAPKIIFLVCLSTVPFIARQTQIACAMGLDFWLHDFYYSFVIKVPYLARIFPLNFDSIDAFYAHYSVLRPPASPAGQQTLWSTINFLLILTDAVLLPEAGFISLCIFGIILLISSVFMINNALPSLTKLTPKIAAIFYSLQQTSQLKDSIKLFFVLMASFGIGLYIFSPFSFHVYLKHQFPLIAIPMHLAKAILIAGISFVFIKNNKLGYSSIICLVAIVLICCDHLKVHMNDEAKLSKLDLGWIADIEKEKNAKYAVSWIPSTVAGFSSNEVIGIKPGNERAIASRYNQSGQLFIDDDLFITNNQTKPDYWLYFTIDKLVPFDSEKGIVQKDYLLQFFKSLTTFNKKAITAKRNWMFPAKAAPGSVVRFGGRLNSINDEIEGIKISEAAPYASKASFNLNANSRAYYGEYIIPEGSNTDLIIPITVVFRDGTSKIIAKHSLAIDNTLSHESVIESKIKHPQLSIDELISAMPNLPVKSRGNGYVIFDLRHL